jgi:HSP20 family molecular chaperone IbpA
MQRMNGTEIVERSSEEILNQCSPAHDLEDWFRAESELLQPVSLNTTELYGEYVVRAEVPGFGGRDIRNRIFRTLELSSDVDTSAVSATVQDGILTVHLPKI